MKKAVIWIVNQASKPVEFTIELLVETVNAFTSAIEEIIDAFKKHS